MQGGIERPVLDLQHLVGALLDDVGDGVAMGGAGDEGVQNQHVERALEHVAAGVCPALRAIKEIYQKII